RVHGAGHAGDGGGRFHGRVGAPDGAAGVAVAHRQDPGGGRAGLISAISRGCGRMGCAAGKSTTLQRASAPSSDTFVGCKACEGAVCFVAGTAWSIPGDYTMLCSDKPARVTRPGGGAWASHHDPAFPLACPHAGNIRPTGASEGRPGL